MFQLVARFLVLLCQVQDQQFLHLQLLPGLPYLSRGGGSLPGHGLSGASGVLDFLLKVVDYLLEVDEVILELPDFNQDFLLLVLVVSSLDLNVFCLVIDDGGVLLDEILLGLLLPHF